MLTKRGHRSLRVRLRCAYAARWWPIRGSIGLIDMTAQVSGLIAMPNEDVVFRFMEIAKVKYASFDP